MFQEITIVGYLGQDPVLRFTPSGKAVTNLSIATSNKYTDSSGIKHDETTWFRCALWNNEAENACKYLKKGNPVLVKGRMKADPNTGGPVVYTKQDGTVGASFEVNAILVRYLPKGGDSTGQPDDSQEPALVEEDAIPF